MCRYFVYLIYTHRTYQSAHESYADCLSAQPYAIAGGLSTEVPARGTGAYTFAIAGGVFAGFDALPYCKSVFVPAQEIMILLISLVLEEMNNPIYM